MGGGMIRGVQRATKAEPFSPSANVNTTIRDTNLRNAKHFNTKQPVSSFALSWGNCTNGTQPFSSLNSVPISPCWGYDSSSTCSSDESEWEWIDGIEDGRARVFHEDYVFGTAPSRVEVDHTVSALKQVLGPRSMKSNITEDPEMDWVEPSLHISDSRKLQGQLHGADGVYHAFHMLQTEPSVQEMVLSLSSDKALWEVVLNNEVVEEVRSRYARAHKLQYEDEDKDDDESSGKGGPDNSHPLKDILSWIVGNAKARIIQLVESITRLLSEASKLPNDGKKRRYGKEEFEEHLRTSVLISVVVILIVVVTRIRNS